MTKKELKAKEDAEFEALMASVPLNTAQPEESKQSEEPKVSEGSSKNKKKKEKKKAAAAKQ